MDYKTARKQILDEMTASQGGVFGAVMQPVGDLQGDFYAPGDARSPFAFDPKKKEKKKKKKGKKAKKKDPNEETGNVLMFRRPVITEDIAMEDPELGCVLACNGKKSHKLALAIIESLDIHIATYDNCIIIEGVDEKLGQILENIMDLLGEDVYENNFMAYISEMNSSVAIDKNKTKYSKGQLSMGSNAEGEHTKDKRLAKLVAQHHLDNDSEYYDKKMKRENRNGQQQQEQRKKLRKSNRKASL